MSNAKTHVLELDGAKLLLYKFPEGTLCIEAYELALFLGYKQQHSIRKQIETSWKEDFWRGPDFEVVHEEKAQRDYERTLAMLVGKKVRPMTPTRGRMFLLGRGLKKVLSKSTKAGADDLALALAYHFPALRAPDLEDLELLEVLKELEPSSSSASTPPDEPRNDPAPSRMRQYKVLQTLLTQLQELKEPALQLLAIEAAEIALGRSLDDLRTSLLKSPWEESSSSALVGPRPPGPLLTQERYYRLSEIGELAGGYPAATAGRAADVVAARMGFSREQIRRTKLDFNELPMLPDNTTGKPRQMYRFNLEFSNAVVVELRHWRRDRVSVSTQKLV